MKRFLKVNQSLRVTCFFLEVVLLWTLAFSPAQAALKNWTNTSGGSWFEPGNWSPNGVPGSSDAVTITNDGTYSVLVPTGSVSTAVINLGGGSGTQTLVYGTPSGQLFVTNSAVHANGVLLVTNGGLQGSLLVQPGGQLQLDTPVNLFLYNFTLTNQGKVTWSNGALSVGGNNSDTTIVANSGLWQIAGDNNMNYGGGGRPIFLNTGTLRKVAGTGKSVIGMDLINLASGVADVSSGTLQFSAFNTNILGGSFTATAQGQMKFFGNQTDAGGTASGTDAIQFIGGTFYLRTNPISQMKLAGGDIYLDGATFQQAGAITNLTLEGAQLRGTNRVAGSLTVNSGNLLESLTVQPGAQLLLAAPGGSLLYSLLLINQGTILWNGAALAVGGTPPTIISNGGTFTMTSDASFNYGGGQTPYFTNSGILQKTAGSGISSLGGFTFVNQPSGIVSIGTGTVQMPNNYTNTAGTLRLNGGTLTTFGTLGMVGGLLDGNGTIGADSVFDAGVVSPGQSGPGLLQFKAGLALGPNATFVVDGVGTSPGTQYDQLSVAGAVSISNATLQVSSLPSVPFGTGFTIINNTGAGAVLGGFNGLLENSLLSVGSRLFSVHYAGGTGNDVLLVGASQTGPQLFSAGYSNNTFHLIGLGSGSAIYSIEATTNFFQWTLAGTATADAAGNFNFVDTNAVNFRYRFYRASQ